MKSEHRALLHDAVIEKQVVAMKIDRSAQHALRHSDTSDVIHVGMGQENMLDRECLMLCEREQSAHLVSGIDQDRFAGLFATNDEAVLEKRRDRLDLDYDGHSVILAVLDDLMFTSKIRAAAGQLGVTVKFARTADTALTEMRNSAPVLVIFDLNSPRTDPLGTLKTMKLDTSLAAIPTVGFVSHVQTGLIEAARQAGMDEVLARSAFTTRLAEILTRQS